MNETWYMVDLRHHKNGHIRIFRNNSDHIANVLSRSVDCKEIAILISKAPAMLARTSELEAQRRELLEACKAAAKMLDENRTVLITPYGTPILYKLKAAIARAESPKAEGR